VAYWLRCMTIGMALRSALHRVQGDAMRFSAIILLLCCQCAQCAIAADAPSLPDWSGVWERFEGNGGIFDPATVDPPDGRAGNPGVRQYPPLTEAWEAKYKANLVLAAKDRLPDPISYCGTPAGFPRLLALPDVYEFTSIPMAEITRRLKNCGQHIPVIQSDIGTGTH